jgi:hypothetical protein
MFQHFPNFTYMPPLDVPELGAAMTACKIVEPALLGTATPQILRCRMTSEGQPARGRRSSTRCRRADV